MMKDIPDKETNAVDVGQVTLKSVEPAHPAVPTVQPRVVIVTARAVGLGSLAAWTGGWSWVTL